MLEQVVFRVLARIKVQTHLTHGRTINVVRTWAGLHQGSVGGGEICHSFRDWFRTLLYIARIMDV
jgi:hypothetical protein